MKGHFRTILKRVQHHWAAVGILLAAWIIFVGKVNLLNIVLGLAVSVLPVVIFPEIFATLIDLKAYKRMPFLFVFLLYLLCEVFLACYRMAYFTLNPKVSLKSSIFAYEHSLKNSTSIFILTTAITLTPGTLVLDINKDGNKIFIHTLDYFTKSKADVFANIELMEKWLRRIFE